MDTKAKSTSELLFIYEATRDGPHRCHTLFVNNLENYEIMKTIHKKTPRQENIYDSGYEVKVKICLTMKAIKKDFIAHMQVCK